MGNIPQIQTGINIEEIHAQTPPASIRRPRSLRLFATHLEHGLRAENTKE